jgi:hypothetical protein
MISLAAPTDCRCVFYVLHLCWALPQPPQPSETQWQVYEGMVLHTFFNGVFLASASKGYIRLCFIIIFNKDWQEVLQQLYKLNPLTNVSKHHSTSTRHRGLDQASCLGHRRLPSKIQRNHLACKFQRSPPPLSLCTHLKDVRLKESLSSGLRSIPPRRQTMPPPCTSPSSHIQR